VSASAGDCGVAAAAGATSLVKNGFTGERYREDEVFTGLRQWLAETSVEQLEAAEREARNHAEQASSGRA
jgi:hypothetical protein